MERNSFFDIEVDVFIYQPIEILSRRIFKRIIKKNANKSMKQKKLMQSAIIMQLKSLKSRHYTFLFRDFFLIFGLIENVFEMNEKKNNDNEDTAPKHSCNIMSL